MGDFNEILMQSEMRGKRTRDRGQIMRFKEAIWDCELKDIEMVNKEFTYSNRRKGIEETKSRNDRAFVNKKWLSIWPTTVLQCCFANTSDHKSIKITLDGDKYRKRTGQRSFRFEPMWLKEVEFTGHVTNTWLEVNQECSSITDKLSRCAGEIQK